MRLNDVFVEIERVLSSPMARHLCGAILWGYALGCRAVIALRQRRGGRIPRRGLCHLCAMKIRRSASSLHDARVC